MSKRRSFSGEPCWRFNRKAGHDPVEEFRCFDSLTLGLIAMTVWNRKSANLDWPTAFLEFDDQVSHADTHLYSLSVPILTGSQRATSFSLKQLFLDRRNLEM